MPNVTEIIETNTEKTLEEKCAFKWEINNTNRMTMPIRTPVFTTLEKFDAKFYLEVWLHSKFIQSVEYTDLLVVLRKLPTSSVHQNLRFQVFLSVQNGVGTPFTEYKENDLETLANFGAKTLINSSSKHSLDSLFTLILSCRMIFSGHLLSPKSYHHKVNSLHKLQRRTRDFMSLYESNAFSDVTIQVGEEFFYPQKFVLAAHSPVFKSMLEQNFLETNSGIITVSEFGPDIFKSFLKFLYTAEIEDPSFTDIKLLYALADKYEVQFLKEECIKILTDSSLSEEEVNDVCQMAQEYNDDILKTAAKSFLVNNFRDNLIKAII